MCVTETWFTPEIENSFVQIPGFLSFRNDRRDNVDDTRRGGGTIIYASTASTPSTVDIPQDIEKPFGIECNIVRFLEPHLSYLMCVYIPAGLNVDTVDRFR